MIKGKIVGTPKQINEVKSLLQSMYPNGRSVSIEIPEAARFGTGIYAAVFSISDVYVDCKKFDQIYSPRIEFYFVNGQRYVKKERSKKGVWFRKCSDCCSDSVESGMSQQTELMESGSEELGDFEELEIWEERVRGKLCLKR